MLSKLKNVPQDTNQGVLSVDLSDVAGDGAILRFREPKAADLFPDAKQLQQMRVAYPEFPEAMQYQIYLLGRTYVPDQEDSGESPIRAFGNLARTSKVVFFRILTAYTTHFALDNFDTRVDDAKNASAE